MKLKSKALISELKTFVAQGNSYSAKSGDTDDLIMASLLVIRMASVIKNYDPVLDDKIRDGEDFDVEPMPFVVM